MDEKQLKALLSDVDEETALRMAEQFPVLPEEDQERLFWKMEQKLGMPVQDPPMTVRQAPKISWRPFAAAAACLLILGGLPLFLGTLHRQEGMSGESSDTENVLSHTSGPVCGIGDRYAAPTLTSCGTLWMTVEKSGFLADDPTLYLVVLKLESEDAVSSAAAVTGERYVFMADNFMLGVSQQGGFWQTVQPCDIEPAGTVHPYGLTLFPGETAVVTLYYRLAKAPAQLAFVTGYPAALPHTVLYNQEA